VPKKLQRLLLGAKGGYMFMPQVTSRTNFIGGKIVVKGIEKEYR
jgi:hypothetical protein